MKTFMLALLFLFESGAYGASMKTKGGEVSFLAKGNPGFMKIEGSSEGKAPIGNLDYSEGQLKGDFIFNLKDLTTGMNLRDDHMKEKYLEVGKYPQAKLILRPLPLNLSEDSEGPFKGDLNLHGVTKEVTGTFTYDAGKKLVRASFPLKVSDYAIDIPSWMGVTVTDTVDVNVISQMP